MVLTLRTLRRSPGFTATVIASLAISFTLVSTVLAVVNAYLARSLPYPDAKRLYHVQYAPPGPWEPRGMSGLDWASVRDVVEQPVTASSLTYYLAEGHAQSVRGLRVSRGFLNALNVTTVAGRSLGESDFVQSAEPGVLIGHALWRDRFGGDPAVVGRTLRVETEGQSEVRTLRIVGVIRPDFWFGRDSGDRVDVILPLLTPARTYFVQLRSGVPEQLAERRITEAARAAGSDIPADWQGVTLEAVHKRYIAGIRPILIALTVAGAVVLVIGWTNVAVLVLLRSLRRRQEHSVRVSLGANLKQIVAMHLAEASVLCAAGLASGLLLTQALLRLIAPLLEANLGRPAPAGTASISLDPLVVLAVSAAGALITFTLGLMPLITQRDATPGETLRKTGRFGTDNRSMRRMRSLLVTLEVGGALVLMVGGGLMVRSVVNLLSTDRGYEIEGLVRTRIVLRGANYPDDAAYTQFYARAAEHIATKTNSLVSFTNWPPFAEPPVQTVEAANDNRTSGAAVVGVGNSYFRALRIDVQQGRSFTTSDRANTEPVAIISEHLARHLWPVGNPIGQQLRTTTESPDQPVTSPWRTVVGIVGNVRHEFDDRQQNDIYVPYLQSQPGRFGSFYLRTAEPIPLVFPVLREIVAELDPQVIVNEPVAVVDQDREMISARFLSSVISVFAVCAAFLAGLGIFGVTAYAVQQREREAAIRMAVGATPRRIVMLFLRETGIVLTAGLLIGGLAAAAAARVLASQLHGVDALDPAAFAGAAALLAIGALFAGWMPARRSGRVALATVLNRDQV